MRSRLSSVSWSIGRQKASSQRGSHHPHHRRHHSACVSRPIARCSREGERGLDLRLEGRIGIEGWLENGTVLVSGPRWGRCRPRSGVGTRANHRRTRAMIRTVMGRCLVGRPRSAEETKQMILGRTCLGEGRQLVHCPTEGVGEKGEGEQFVPPLGKVGAGGVVEPGGLVLVVEEGVHCRGWGKGRRRRRRRRGWGYITGTLTHTDRGGPRIPSPPLFSKRNQNTEWLRIVCRDYPPSSNFKRATHPHPRSPVSLLDNNVSVFLLRSPFHPPGPPSPNIRSQLRRP